MILLLLGAIDSRGTVILLLLYVGWWGGVQPRLHASATVAPVGAMASTLTQLTCSVGLRHLYVGGYMHISNAQQLQCKLLTAC